MFKELAYIGWISGNLLVFSMVVDYTYKVSQDVFMTSSIMVIMGLWFCTQIWIGESLRKFPIFK